MRAAISRHRNILRRPVAILAIVMLVWLLVPGALKNWIRTGFYEFQAPSWVALSHIDDLQEYWMLRTRSRHDLIAAGRDLARLNAAYEVRLQQESALREELRALESLLRLDSLPEYHYMVARVVRRDHSSWWQQCIIRKGRTHGIRKGMAVIYSQGVVGRIREVHAYTATVELVTSPSFRMAAHFSDDLRPITFQGGVNTPFHPPRGHIANVPADVRIGDDEALRLVSSRLGGVFPDGLTIGYVEQLEPSPDGLFQSGRVRMTRGLLSVREVAVLVPIDQLQQD